uniref:Uncharacterized protein n=1 Tax=Salix viminalis TaxID=40686 RepID=A0A6N2LUA2_SALVM
MLCWRLKGIKLIIVIQISTLINICWITIKQLKLLQRSTNLFSSPDLISEWIVNPEGFLLRNPNINTHLLKIFILDCKLQFWPYLQHHHKEMKPLSISDFTNCNQT